MANYNTLQLGSSGSDVKSLQQMLTDKGYDVGGVDGIFGNNTLKGVRQYQKDNGLTVDGIVGNNTWGSLYGNTTADTSAGNGGTTPTAPTTPTNPSSPSTGGKIKGSANMSDKEIGDYLAELEQPAALWENPYLGKIENAQKTWDDWQANNQRPGEYVSNWGQQIEDALKAVQDRKEFSYDYNTDPIYQQYRSQYIRDARRAMQEAQANGAILTGGYGNSYGQLAGQQAYNDQMYRLNNVIPELYEAAYGRYQDENKRLLEMLGVYRDLDADDYSRYIDTVNDYYTRYGLAHDTYMDDMSMFNKMGEQDFDHWLANQNLTKDERNYWRSVYEDSQKKNLTSEGSGSGSSGGSGGRRSGGSGGSGGGYDDGENGGFDDGSNGNSGKYQNPMYTPDPGDLVTNKLPKPARQVQRELQQSYNSVPATYRRNLTNLFNQNYKGGSEVPAAVLNEIDDLVATGHISKEQYDALVDYYTGIVYNLYQQPKEGKANNSQGKTSDGRQTK